MNGLFLTAGAFIFKTGINRLSELRGIGRRMPVTLWCFTFLSLALVGIPPMPGFVSKWYLASGALDSNLGALVWIVTAVILSGTLLTAGYLMKIVITGFFAGNEETVLPAGTADPQSHMLIPILIFTAASVLLGICASPIIETVKNLIM
jgi:multicomponent Na+:H+ antiporter subunit D